VLLLECVIGTFVSLLLAVLIIAYAVAGNTYDDIVLFTVSRTIFRMRVRNAIAREQRALKNGFFRELGLIWEEFCATISRISQN